MRRPRARVRRRWRVALGLACLPPAFWMLVLAVVPTDHARQAIAQRLSNSSGRAVRIGALRVSPLGGVRLGAVEIGAPQPGTDPFLKVREVSLDVSLVQLLFGQVEPSAVRVGGVDLRVLRRSDGTFELADFLTPAGPEREAADRHHTRRPLSLDFQDANLTLVDQPTGTRLALTGISGHAACDGILSTLSDVQGAFNGGTFQLAAQLDRNGASPAFEGQFRARDVALSAGEGSAWGALEYLLPVLSGATGAQGGGRLAADFYLRGSGNSRQEFKRTCVGRGHVDLDPIKLEGSRMLADLAQFAKLPEARRVGSARADLTLGNGRVASENLTLSVAQVPFVFAGWTDFDGNVDYRLRADGINRRVADQARDLLARFDLRLDDLADVRVEGKVGAARLVVDGVNLSDPSGHADDPRRWEQLGRKLRDRVRR